MLFHSQHYEGSEKAHRCHQTAKGLKGPGAHLGVAQRELGIFKEQAHVYAPNKELSLFALKLDLEALWQAPVLLPLRLQTDIASVKSSHPAVDSTDRM